jgi:hypothetical protein
VTVFELPVIARRAETVARLLGGATALAAQVYGAVPSVDLRLRPDDTFSHVVKGQRLAATGFFVRVRPARGGGDGGGGGSGAPACAALTGVALTAYRWSSLADFQSLPEGTPLAADAGYAAAFIGELNEMARSAAGKAPCVPRKP